MAKIIGQQGAFTYMIDVGDGEFQGTTQRMGRVYERLQGKLLDPWPIAALTARGYWEDPSDPPEIQSMVSAEIDKLLT